MVPFAADRLTDAKCREPSRANAKVERDGSARMNGGVTSSTRVYSGTL